MPVIQLTLLIPCFNEEKRIKKKFSQTYNYLRKNFKSFEIILINDGSSDQTKQVLEKLTKDFKQVKFISYSRNKGKGYALKKGVKKALGQVIGFTDADFAVSSQEIKKAVNLIRDGADLVIGDRTDPRSTVIKNPPKGRGLLGRLLAEINNFFLDLGQISDTQNGFKFLKKRVAKNLFAKLTINRWLFDIELIKLAQKKEFKIVKIPISWSNISGSKVNIKKDFWPVVKDLARIYAKFFSDRMFKVILGFSIILIVFPFILRPAQLVLRNGDYSDLVWPDYYFFKESVLKFHQIPLWNPTLFSGIPEIANPQSPIIYFPNWIILFIPINFSIILLLVLHAYLGGIFIYKTASKLWKWSNISSVVSALVFSLSPFFWSKAAVGHLSQFFAIMLTPAIFYFGFKLTQKFQLGIFLSLAFFLACQYLNYPTIWYFCVLFGFLSLILLGSAKLKSLVKIGLAVFSSLILISPVILMQLKAGPLITRSILNYHDLAIPIWSIKRFVTSVLLPSYLYSDNETEVWLYFSLTALLLGLAGFRKLSGRIKKMVGLCLIFLVLITLGSRTPIFGLLVRYLPGFSYLRVATRDWFLVVFILALLAGWGIEKAGRLKFWLAGLIFLDLIIFATTRMWFVPPVMQPYTNVNLQSLLFKTNDKYYCTSRCLSARETLPLGIDTADGYHLIILRSYREAISKAGGFKPPSYTGNIPSVENIYSQPSATALGKFSVGYVISRTQLSDSLFIKVGQVNGYDLYQNQAVLPKVRFKNLTDNQIQVLKDSPNQVEVKTFGKADRLVFADSYFPGWKVMVDGVESTLLIEDSWAKAVELSSGQHQVEFLFDPFANIFKI